MIVVFAALGGALWGGYLARKRGGKALDIAQYAAGYSIALSLAGLFVTIFIERSLNVDGKRPFILEGLVSAAMKIDAIAPIEIHEVSGVDEVVASIKSPDGREMLMGS